MDYEVNIILLVCCTYIAIIAVSSVLRHHADTASDYVVQRRWSWVLVVFWAAVAVASTSGAVFFLRAVTTRWVP
jgi:hypothetical protein